MFDQLALEIWGIWVAVCDWERFFFQFTGPDNFGVGSRPLQKSIYRQKK
jgi:hypothetical protein